MPRPVRVRMAPSPTGFVHVGSARTALFNDLFAHRHSGTFVLRLDDTDMERNQPEMIDPIVDGFRWLGIEWQEGWDVGGPFGPYRQSERIDIYREQAARLLAEEKAYRCYCTPEELAEERRQAEAERRPYVYSRRCLTNPPKGRDTFTVRFLMPHEEVVLHDLIRSEVRFDTALIGDPVIVKSSGQPLYNFASPVDDGLMEITHVIRGEDHVPNTPIQILLTRALGFEPPEAYAHLPLILAPDRSKLSKRRHRVMLTDFRDEGYLPEAMTNYLALLGWNPGTEQELFTLAELREVFDLARVQHAGAVFDREKLDWLNKQWVMRIGDLADRLAAYLPNLPPAQLPLAAEALSERLPKLADAPNLLAYLWTEPEATTTDGQLSSVVDALAATDWRPDAIEAALNDLVESLGTSKGKLYGAIRTALTGQKVAPPIHYTLALLPKETALERLRRAA
ncbi:MAG TPA: glutamate--tRNA ligase [Candidatus Dormibacteraeota bacterium]